MRQLILPAVLLLAGCASQPASPGMFQPRQRELAPYSPPPRTAVDEDMKKDAVTKGIAVLLKLQSGDNHAEWPYEGVYRVKGEIPWGYRVGGTAIVVSALTEAPGYADDKPRQEAVARAVKFICDCKDQPLLSVKDYEGNYDVRSWGHIEAVHTLCRMKQMDLIPKDQADAVEAAIAFYLDAIQQLEIPKNGGWNYARPAGRDTPGSPSTFMTASALHALYEAAAAGYKVDPAVITRALDFLEKARAASGAMMYAGPARSGEERTSDAVPGATGRMVSGESALLLAGRSSPANVRGAVDAFIVNWDWLNRRRAQPNTHLPPYMIAPYYFMFAHSYAAEAVELLPKAERAELRRHINELLFSVRAEDGSWNDRVFERSGAYGTAMAMLAITAPDRRPPAHWEAPEAEAAKP